MTDRLQMNLMFDVTAFSVFRAKKFSARGHVIKKRAHHDFARGHLTSHGLWQQSDPAHAIFNSSFGPGNCEEIVGQAHRLPITIGRQAERLPYNGDPDEVNYCPPNRILFDLVTLQPYFVEL